MYSDSNSHPFTLQSMQIPVHERFIGPQLPIVTCVVPFHKATQLALQEALIAAPFPQIFRMRAVPSYANSLPSLSGMLKRHAKSCFNNDDDRVGTRAGISSSSNQFTFARLCHT